MSSAPSCTLRRGDERDAPVVTALFRLSFRSSLPHFPDLHTPEEDLAFFTKVAATSELWLAEDAAGSLAGFIAFKPGAVEHLYVHPSQQGRGIGRALLQVAMDANDELKLWTFQDNDGARKFYERLGFDCDRMTEGMGNEERMPDMRYVWRKPQSSV